MAADPTGRHEPPPEPYRADGSGGRTDELMAWWAPLLQLSTYAFGWAFPMRGLARWDQAGRPTGDPVFALIQRWWGSRLVDVLAWGQDFIPGQADAPNLAAVSKLTGNLKAGQDGVPARGSLFHPYTFRQSERDWLEVWQSPGSNKFHSWGHASVPERNFDPEAVWLHARAGSKLGSHQNGGPREALVLDRFAGWYSALRASCTDHRGW